MRATSNIRGVLRLSGIALLLVGVVALPARADVCLSIDEARDTFSTQERTAALLLLATQFEREGEHVVAAGCPNAYEVSHIQFGSTIIIALRGPGGRRDATALGMDDVPAVYSQMVRSLLRNQPMNAAGVVDRTNVTAAQSERRRVYSDSVTYARLGYGGIFGDRLYSGPAVGVIGYRKEFDAFAIDVSFLNFQYKSSNRTYGYLGDSSGSGGMTGSWLKLEALHFINPLAASTPYFGGGFSWSSAHLDNENTTLDGSGLQGELSVGYELARASTVRVFIQTDAGLPFFTLRSETFSYLPTSPYVSVSSGHRYAPSVNVSLGLGWQRGGGGGR